MSAAAWAWITTARDPPSTARRITHSQEYTNDIVYYIADVCNAEGVPHPNIVSESGRAIVAHHSVLIVEVFGAIEKNPPGIQFEYGDNEHRARPGVARHAEEPRQAEQARGLSRRAGTPGGRASNVHARHDGAAGQSEDRKSLLGDFPGCRAKVSRARPTSPRKSASSRTASAISTSAIFPCSNRCSIIGRSASSFPSCRSVG